MSGEQKEQVQVDRLANRSPSQYQEKNIHHINPDDHVAEQTRYNGQYIQYVIIREYRL
jgi:hypothetical protein